MDKDNLIKALNVWNELQEISLRSDDKELRELLSTAELAVGRMAKILAKRFAGNVKEKVMD